jgi:hypothetical protein
VSNSARDAANFRYTHKLQIEAPGDFGPKRTFEQDAADVCYGSVGDIAQGMMI